MREQSCWILLKKVLSEAVLKEAWRAVLLLLAALRL